MKHTFRLPLFTVSLGICIVSSVHARDFKNCSVGERRMIEDSEELAAQFLESSLPRVHEYLGDKSNKRFSNYRKIKEVAGRMRCMLSKLEKKKYNYTCHASECRPDWRAYVWTFSFGVWAFNSNRIYYCAAGIGMASAQVHEMAHTCGAEDVFYMWQIFGTPFGLPDWENNADTFAYLYKKGIEVLPWNK